VTRKKTLRRFYYANYGQAMKGSSYVCCCWAPG